MKNGLRNIIVDIIGINMKIIFKGCTIELTYEEFQKLFPLKTKGERGKYRHKSKVTDYKKKLIKRIFEQYPDRSERTVANELKLTRDQVRYWRYHD